MSTCYMSFDIVRVRGAMRAAALELVNCEGWKLPFLGEATMRRPVAHSRVDQCDHVQALVGRF